MLVWFTTEYVLRVWSAGCRSRFQGLAGRLSFMSTPFCIIGAHSPRCRPQHHFVGRAHTRGFKQLDHYFTPPHVASRHVDSRHDMRQNTTQRSCVWRWRWRCHINYSRLSMTDAGSASQRAAAINFLFSAARLLRGPA